ncbi:MAG TPA: DUF2703 domain-containing protein [Solirubrobacteraceae bacterium]|nr:DUF2703 domain-containing protein [Solirubrobacteraceae bacterium]
MAVEPIAATGGSQAPDTLRIDILFLDLTSCARCLAADRSLEPAIDAVRDVLRASGVDVEVNKVLVESAEQALALRFVSSPTIRVDGRDVALELRESSCGSEACADGCSDQIACRVWLHRGQEYTEPPVALIVEAILAHVYGGTRSGVASAASAGAYELPQNLARFFSGRAAAEQSACCTPSEQRSCCAEAAKEECCVVSTAGGCGCR